MYLQVPPTMIDNAGKTQTQLMLDFKVRDGFGGSWKLVSSILISSARVWQETWRCSVYANLWAVDALPMRVSLRLLLKTLHGC